MSKLVEFDISHAYSEYEIGIVVETRLRFAKATVVIDARLDTGSTYCIFERQFGERLGLEIETGISATISTATGSFRTFGHRLEFDVLGMTFESTAYFAQDEHFNRNVLGRIGFLDRVKLGLIDHEHTLLLSKYE